MKRRDGHRGAFTLVELLVVVGIIALLVTILMPSLGRALDLTRSAICKSQLGGLVRANQIYAADSDEHYVPFARDMHSSDPGRINNLHRWHGVRTAQDEPFDPSKGPLASYLGSDGRIKQCPSFRDFLSGGGSDTYEDASGGYGYSDLYVGAEFLEFPREVGDVRTYDYGRGQLRGAHRSAVGRPAETVMFTDAAMCKDPDNSHYIEESAACCRHLLPSPGSTEPGAGRTPTIHFRHLGSANVGWCDGHVTGRDDFHSISLNVYGANPEQMQIGWFGPDDNSLFDLE